MSREATIDLLIRALALAESGSPLERESIRTAFALERIDALEDAAKVCDGEAIKHEALAQRSGHWRRRDDRR